MKKPILIVLLSVLVLLLPIGVVAGMAFGLPAQYSNTFLGEMAVKFDRLTSVEEPKVVVVGGSSVAFGLDSAALEEAVGRPVVNYGLYATLGTKYMIDTSKAGIGEGDIQLDDVCTVFGSGQYGLFGGGKVGITAGDKTNVSLAVFESFLELIHGYPPRCNGRWQHSPCHHGRRR